MKINRDPKRDFKLDPTLKKSRLATATRPFETSQPPINAARPVWNRPTLVSLTPDSWRRSTNGSAKPTSSHVRPQDPTTKHNPYLPPHKAKPAAKQNAERKTLPHKAIDPKIGGWKYVYGKWEYWFWDPTAEERKKDKLVRGAWIGLQCEQLGDWACGPWLNK